MTNREKLQENYEDSVLALLMDEFAQSEGQRYIEENERLCQDPDAAVPEELEKRALHLIDQQFSRRNRRNNGGKLLRFLGRLAIAAVIAVLLFGAAFALSETVRAGTLNFLMQIDERIATWQFVEDDETASYENSDNVDLNVGWLPEGYYESQYTEKTPVDVVIDYSNSNGGLIRVSVHEGEDFINTMDIENSDDYKEVVINNCRGLLITKDGIIRVCWAYYETEFVLSVISSDVDEAVLLHVAESVNLLF